MPWTRLRIAAACSLALLASCASYTPAPISPARNADAIEARSLNDPRLRTFIAAARVPDSLTDPSAGAEALPAWDLTTLTLAAVYYHPSLDIARARLAGSRAGVTTARQIPNPSLSFEDLSYGASTRGASEWTVAPVINFLIETAGKRKYRTREARARVESAHADLAMAAWEIRGGVRDSLLTLWAAQRRLALLHEGLDLQDQLATLLEHRLVVGEASALDVARARTRRNQMSLAVDDAQLQKTVARTQLAAAIGISLRAFTGVDFSFGTFETPEVLGADVASGALRQEALTHRSDVQALLAQYAAAEGALALQIANQYPNITLSPGYSFDSVQNRYLLLPAVDLPVFNHNQGPIAEGLAQREEAAARFTALQTQVMEAIDGSAADYRAATQSVATADALLEGERDRERRTLQSFQAGAVNRPTVLTVQLERLAAEQSRFAALVQQRQALGALEDALEHPFFGPALPLSSEINPRVPSAPRS